MNFSDKIKDKVAFMVIMNILPVRAKSRIIKQYDLIAHPLVSFPTSIYFSKDQGQSAIRVDCMTVSQTFFLLSFF